MQDVIQQNQITTIFQNDERPRQGKFGEPLFADYMVKLLMKVH